MRTLGLLTLLACVFFRPIPIHAVDIESDPEWVVFQKGKQLFESGSYGESLFYFRKARERAGSYPEVEFWIGRVFEAEGEYSLAERQYAIALESADFLEIRDELYDIRYRLAEIYFSQKRFSQYADELQAIVARDQTERSESEAIDIDPRLLAVTLSERGMDKLLELYRLKNYGGLEAYYRLGVYKLRTGFVENAAELLTMAMVMSFTRMIGVMIEHDPEYRFSTLPALLTSITGQRSLMDYMSSVDAFGQLYALALALRGSGERPKMERADELLSLTARYDEAGYWGARAAEQLSAPFDEDFMIIY